MPFEHPHVLWALLVVVPGLVAFLFWAWRRRRELAAQFVGARLLSSLTVGVSASRQKLRMGLVVAAVALLIAALARPQFGFSWEEARSRGLDIVVAIDTSRSMLATDVSPNRLRRAQLAALDLKRLARTDRLGLVAFAGSAFLQCPLTLDDEAFRQSVEALDVNIIPQGGTALAEALAAARSAFRESSENHRVVVLFTDGEDHDGDALEAAKKAGKDGLRVFTVGVGTPAGELLRTVDVQGRTEFIKDNDGNAVKSRLDEKLLQEMADATGGFFLPLSGANPMQALYESGLAPLPKGDLASQRVKRPHERYQWLLAVVVALLLLEIFVPERPSPFASAAQNASTDAPSTSARVIGSSAGLLLLLGVLALAASSSAHASSAEGLKQYQRGQYDRALSEYEQLLAKKPDDARLHFNAGTAAFQNKEFEQALTHLTSALVTPDLLLQQRAYYNIGNTLFRLGEGEADTEKKRSHWQRAVSSYESVLKLDPKDADAEFNRELVKRRLEQLKSEDQKKDKDKEKKHPSDAAKKAKSQADEAVRRREYRAALEIMENQLKIDSTTSYYAEYIERLRQINGISNPAAAPVRSPQSP